MVERDAIAFRRWMSYGSSSVYVVDEQRLRGDPFRVALIVAAHSLDRQRRVQADSLRIQMRFV